MRKPQEWDRKKGLELYQQGWTDRKIAEELGVSANVVGGWRRANDMPANRPKPGQRSRKWDTAKAQQLYEAGMSDREIARAVGVSESAVGGWRREQGYIKGAYRRKWDTQKAEEMTRAGHTDAEIARELGTTEGAVASWRYRKGLIKSYRLLGNDQQPLQ